MKIIVSESGEQFVVPRRTKKDRQIERRRATREWQREQLSL